MSSQPRRNLGAADDSDSDSDSDSDDANADFFKSNKVLMSSLSTKLMNSMEANNLRRRPNAARATNGEYRLGERKHGEPNLIDERRSQLHPLPNSLTPFAYVRDTDMSDKLIGIDTRSTSSKSKKQETDVEAQLAQQLQNRTISYDGENPFHASNLSIDSFTDFNNSGQRDSSSTSGHVVVGNMKSMAPEDAPSVDDENGVSFRSSHRSYDSQNGDERPLTNSDTSRLMDASSRSKDPPTSSYGKFQRSRRIVGRCVNNEYVQITIILFIVLNGILMGFSVTKMVKDDPKVAEVVSDTDRVFLIIFTIEILAQFYYFAFAIFLDWWLVFDLVVVIISWSSEYFQVVRSFRIFRAFRLVTRVKPLRDLVLALGQVLPRMTAIVALLMVVFYVFAVLFTELYAGNEQHLDQPFFETLGNSLFTCFQMMTMEWVEICRGLMVNADERYAWIPISLFVAIAGFIVFNLIVAVVVEAVANTEETVRQLDGIESNSPVSKLAEAQERVDLLQSHLNEMMEQQEQIQFMLETMAGELLHLETERMKAKYRENRLKEEINRRIEYQKKIEEQSESNLQVKPNDALKNMSMKFLQKIEAQKVRRKEEEENQAEMNSQSDHDSGRGSAVKSSAVKSSVVKKKKSTTSWVVTPGLMRGGSGKSLVSDKSESSAKVTSKTFDSPNLKSTSSARKKSETTSLRKGSNRKDPNRSELSTDGKKKAMNNWKKLLAVQKEIDL